MKKRIISLLLVVACVFALVACGNTASETDGDEKVKATTMTMGTGGTAGTYYGYGGVLGQYIKNKAGINVTVVSTDGLRLTSKVLMQVTINLVQFNLTLWHTLGKEHVHLKKTVK